MDIPWFSTTVIQGLELCAVRALVGHEERIEHGDDFTGSNPTRFGSIVHEVAEVVHEYDAKGDASPEPLDVFDDVWRRHHLTDQDYFSLGRGAIEAFIDRTLFERNGVTIATEWPFIIDLVEMEVHPIPVDLPLAKRKAFLVRTCKRIKKRGGVPVISMIDRIDRVSKTELEIFDYKTNAQPFTRYQVEESIQLALYDMAVRAHWPKVKEVLCTFDLFRHGRQATRFPDEDRERIRAYIINLWHQVHEWDEPVPSLNAFCGWCDYRYDCEVYAQAVEGELLNEFAPEGLSVAELWEEYQLVKNVEKLAKARASAFGAVIVGTITDDNDGEPLPVDDEHEIYLQLNPRYEYPIESVLPILQREGAVSMLKWAGSISRPGLDKLIKAHPAKDEIESKLLTTFASPSLRKRKRKTSPKKKKKK